MAEFGNHTIEPSWDTGWGDTCGCQRFTLSETGDVTDIYIYISNQGGGSGVATNMKAAIWDDNGIPNTWAGQHFFFCGRENRFLRNVVTARTGSRGGVFRFVDTVNMTMTGNTIHRSPVPLSVAYNSNTNLVTTPNTED